MDAEEEPEIIMSDLCADVEIDGHFLTVGIYKSDVDPGWILEVINEFGTSTVFDDPFLADGLAWQQFEKTMIVELPGVVPAGKTGSDTLCDAMDEISGEFPGTVPVALWTSEPNIMIMKDKVVRTPADLAGLKIRVAGATAGKVAEALGATPVQMPINQVYNSLQTGLIDGVFTGASTLSDFKLDEVADAFTLNAPLGRLAFFAVMGQGSYDALSDEAKAALDEARGCALGNNAETAWNATADAALEAARADAGNTFVDLTAEEAQAFEDAVANVVAEYVSSVGGEAALAAMQN